MKIFLKVNLLTTAMFSTKELNRSAFRILKIKT